MSLLLPFEEKKVYELDKSVYKNTEQKKKRPASCGRMCGSYLDRVGQNFQNFNFRAQHVQQQGQLPHKGVLLLLCPLPYASLQDQLHQATFLRVWDREDMGILLGNHRLDNTRSKAYIRVYRVLTDPCVISTFGF